MKLGGRWGNVTLEVSLKDVVEDWWDKNNYTMQETSKNKSKYCLLKMKEGFIKSFQCK